jgi:hypothetical protein
MNDTKAKITEALLVVTTKCNMLCPNCFLEIPKRKGEHRLIDHLLSEAECLRGVECIHLTGGEPSIHDQFLHLAGYLRYASGAKSVVVTTNAFILPEGIHRGGRCGFDEFDRIYVSQYSKDFYPGFPGNAENVEKLVARYGDKVLVGTLGPGDHTPHRIVSKAQPCHRYKLGSVLVFSGRVWPCCSAPIPLEPDGLGTPLDDNGRWREQIARDVPPCYRCRFATGDEA